MRPDPASVVPFFLMLAALGAFIGGLVSAIVLRAAAHWALRLEIEFWSAFGTVFFASLVNGAIGFVAGLAMSTAFHENPALLLPGELAMLLVNFLVLSVFVSARHTLTFRQAMKVVLYMYLIVLLIVVVVGAAVTGALLFTGVLRH
jgi:hypothetical protein